MDPQCHASFLRLLMNFLNFFTMHYLKCYTVCVFALFLCCFLMYVFYYEFFSPFFNDNDHEFTVLLTRPSKLGHSPLFSQLCFQCHFSVFHFFVLFCPFCFGFPLVYLISFQKLLRCSLLFRFLMKGIFLL
jgi:hypothetical protein